MTAARTHPQRAEVSDRRWIAPLIVVCVAGWFAAIGIVAVARLLVGVCA